MQITPELMEVITRQVMQALHVTQSDSGCRPSVLVLGEKEDALCLSGQFHLETPDSVQEVTVAEYEAIVITQLNTELLSDIAQGLCRCAGAGAVSEALFLGKAVYVAEEGVAFLKYKHTANARYYQMFLEYLKKLESFGIKVLPMEKICQDFSVKETGNMEICEKPEKREEKKASGLFSADMARTFIRSGETTLRLAKGTLLTPLAKDVLREKKIELIYES